MSSHTARTTFLDASASRQRAFSESSASMVDRPTLKPYCASERAGPTSSRCWTRRLARILSNTFATSSNGIIVLYPEGSSRGRPGFRIRHSRPSFHNFGNCPTLMHALNSLRKRLFPCYEKKCSLLTSAINTFIIYFL